MVLVSMVLLTYLVSGFHLS